MEQPSVLQFPKKHTKLPAHQLSPAVAVDVWINSKDFEHFSESILDDYYGIVQLEELEDHIAIIFIVESYVTGIVIKK